LVREKSNIARGAIWASEEWIGIKLDEEKEKEQRRYLNQRLANERDTTNLGPNEPAARLDRPPSFQLEQQGATAFLRL